MNKDFAVLIGLIPSTLNQLGRLIPSVLVSFRLVRKLRLSLKYRTSEHDRVLIDLIGRLGFEVNPALQLVGTKLGTAILIDEKLT
jgi:hypothetical protein